MEELKNALKKFLEVTKPMVEDWTSCPECGKVWHDHKKDCRLKNAVDEAEKVLNGKIFDAKKCLCYNCDQSSCVCETKKCENFDVCNVKLDERCLE